MVTDWAQMIAGRARATLAIGIIIVIGAGIYGAGVFDSLAQGGFDDPGSESAIERDREQQEFGNLSPDVIAIFSSDTLAVDDPQFRAEVQDVLDDLPGGTTSSVTDYWTTQDPRLLSEDKQATQVVISLAGDGQNAMSQNYEELRPALEPDGAEVTVAVTGSWAVFGDVNRIVAEDLARAEVFSLPIVLVLSLLIFGSLVAALMPVMIGAVSVVGALAIVRILTNVTEVSVFSINIITLLGMGLAIDYALFIVSRFREELAQLRDDDPNASSKAIVTTMKTAGRTVLFSGLTVASAMASLLVFPQNFLFSLGLGGIAAVVIAMIAALTILPATLRLLGRRIDAGRLPWRRHRAVAAESDHGLWAALAHSVMRRPVIYLAVITVALLAVAAPFLGVKWGSVDYRVLPAEAPAHVAAKQLNTDFGPETSTASILIEDAIPGEVTSYIQEIGAVDDVTEVRSVATQGDATLLRAAWEGNSQTQASQDVIVDLRAVDVPEGSTVLIGGQSAATVDLLDSIGSHLIWMALIVIGVMLVLLFLAFGSVVLPIKAVLMNALSISASFGVVTWIFADGHLEDLLGFTSSGFLDATQPILMLAILFGLSMDYEVFLLSRVREQWDHSHDNQLAVATGVQKTGRIITSAALLLAVVIGAFATSGIVFMKMIGVGMLVALLIDATIVRALLVPATMKLLGDWNWWAPRPMRRWWEKHGLHEV